MSEKTKVGADTGALTDVFEEAQEAQGVIRDALSELVRAINLANTQRAHVPLIGNLSVNVKFDRSSSGQFILIDCGVLLVVQPFAFKRG